MRKRILSVILLICMLVNNLPVAAFANEATSDCAHDYVEGVCTVCSEPEPQPCAHTGGTATCKELAVCEVCGESYGQLADHVYSEAGKCACGAQCEHEYNAEGVCTVCGMAEPQPECGCTVKCADTGSETCEVCKADLTQCAGAEPEPEAPVVTVSDWEWVDQEEIYNTVRDVAELAGVGSWEDVQSMLPAAILVDGTEVAVTWECEDFAEASGTYTLTATLPEGYVLEDGSNTLSLTLEMGVDSAVYACQCISGDVIDGSFNSLGISTRTKYYRLSSSPVTQGDRREISVKGTVYLCLHGQTWTIHSLSIQSGASLTIYDCGGSNGGTGQIITNGAYNSITNSGSLTLRGGSISGNSVAVANLSSAELRITGNTASLSGKTYGVENLGTFIMETGTVSGNTYGVKNSGNFTMSGGTVSGTSDYGIYNNNTLRLCDSPTITGTTADIYLPSGKKINVTGELTNSRPIGVTMQTPGTFLTLGSENKSYATVENFTSDNPQYVVKSESAEDGSITFSLATARTITVTNDSSKGTVQVPTVAAEGETITVTATPSSQNMKAVVTVTAADSSAVAVTAGSEANTFTFTMPDKDVTVKVSYEELVTAYDLWVGGVQVTSENLTINSEDNADITNGSATYDPENSILTLNGFTYEGEGQITDNGNSRTVIKSDIPLVIKLVGNNIIKITQNNANNIEDINSNAEELTITSDNRGENSLALTGISAKGATISNVTLSVSRYISAEDITIENSTVTAAGIGGDPVTIKDGSDVTANKVVGKVDGDHSCVTVDNSDLTVTDYVDYGILALSINITNGAKVTVKDPKGNGSGINVAPWGVIEGQTCGLTIDGNCTVEVTSNAGAFNASEGGLNSHAISSELSVWAGDDAESASLVSSPTAATYLSKYVKIAPLPPHEHCICGEDDCTNTNHNKVTFSPWNGTGNFPGGNVYLTKDVNVSLTFTEDTNLCLNGHSISTGNTTINEGKALTLTDCAGNGTLESSNDALLENNGTLTVYGGSIKSPYEAVVNKGTFHMYGGSVSSESTMRSCCTNYGTFYLYGGTVSGKSSAVANFADFEMSGGIITGADFGLINELGSEATVSGGAITDNEYGICVNGGEVILIDGDVTDNEYGVSVEDGNTVTISGTPNFAENIECDIELLGAKYNRAKIAVNAPLDEAYRIRLLMEDPGTFLSYTGGTAFNYADADNFVSKNEGHVVFKESSVKSEGTSYTTIFSLVSKKTVNVPDETDEGKVTVSETPVFPGETVTFTAVSKAGYAVESVAVSYIYWGLKFDVAVNDGQNGTYTFTMPNADVTITVTYKKSINPTVTLDDWTYGDKANEPSVTGNLGGGEVIYSYKEKDADDSTYSTTVPTDAGEYTVKAEIAATDNYGSGTAIANFTIARKPVAKPTVSGTYTYTGQVQTVALNGFNSSYMTVSGNTGTNAGDYVAVITLTNSNYRWADGSDGKIRWSIAKAAITPAVTLEGWTFGQQPKTPAVTGNTGNGTVTYSYKVKGADDSTYSNTVPTAAGDYTVKAEIAATDNYGSGTAITNFTIAKAAITPAVTLEGWTYGETAKTPSVTGNTGNGTVTYSYKVKDAADSTYSATVPTNAGDYTVKATVAESANYKGAEATADFTIEKAAITPAVNIEGWTYGETAKAPSVTGNSGGGEVTYSYKGAADSTYSNTVPTAAGDYTVKAAVAETGNYLGGTATEDFTIAKADAAGTVSAVTGLTYNGTAWELVTAETATGGTYQYKLGANGQWGDQIPKATDAGDYTVYWKLEGDTNHTGHDGGTITVTIGRLAIDKPEADTTEFIYDGSPKTYTVASSNGYTVTGNTQTNADQYTVTVQLNSNYKWSDDTTADLTFDFTIAQKAVAEPAVISTYTYTGAEQTVTLNGFDETYMTVIGNKGTNAGNYEAIVTLNSNYKWADDDDGKIPWSIANATLTDVSVVQKDSLTFTGAAQIPTVTTAATAVGNQQVTFTYTTDVNGTYIANLPQFTYGGDYTVYYKATAANHNNATGSFTVTVGRKIVELPTVENKVYTGKPLTADLVDTALYAVTQGTDWTDVGSYNVTLTLKNTNNYTWENSPKVETLVFKIIQATNEWTQTPAISGWTYGDNANAPVAKAKFGEVAVRYEGENYSSTAVPTAAGNYKAVFTVAGTANYTELTEVVVDFTIAKDEIQLTAAPSAENRFFDETEKELVRAGTCSQEGPVFYYAMTTVNSEPDADAYSTAIPKAKNAGTYYVWYYAAGENFHTTQIKCVEVTIHKQPVALPEPSDGTLSLVYGQTLDELQLTSYWRWANPDEKPTVENNGYLIYFDFPGDPANYDLAAHTDKWNEEKQRIESIWPVVVSKYQVAKPAVDATQFLYNGAEQTYTVAASDWYTVTGNTCTNAGTQYVQIALVDTANCEWADSTDADSATAALQYSFTVQPKPVTVTAKKQTIIYNNSIETTVDQAEATGLVAGHAMTEVVLTASTTDCPGGKITPSAAVIRNGDADMTGNYDITYADGQLVINKAEQTAPSLEKTDETIAAKNDGIISKVDGTMEYKLDGADAWTSVEEGKEKLTGLSDGTYLVRYKEKNNFNASPVTTVVIAPGRQLTVTTDPVKESQIGYSFTVDPAAVDYQGETQLTLVLNQEYNKLENQFRITHNGTDVTDKLTADNKLTLSGLTEDAAVKIQGIGDTVAPQVTITVAPSTINTFLRVITFGAVNKAQDVTITASDGGSGVQDISYYVASKELTDAEIAVITWKGYNGSFQLKDDGRYVVYAKVSDRTGNVTVVNSDGIILDTVAPTVTGVENGQTYYGDQTVTITDGVSVTVTLDGETVTPEDGKVTIPANNAERTLSITDAAGNVAEYKITVYKIYTVTFVADGKTVTTQQVNHNANADMTVAIPRKAGYTDKAPIWSLDGATAADGKAITADTTFTAVYYKNEPGVYENTTVSSSNTAGVDVDNSIEELKAAVPMTDEELLLVEQGEDVKIWMVSTDASASVPAEDKTLVRSALSGGVVGMYLDIDLFKQIGDNAPVQVTALKNKITVTLDVPSALINRDFTRTRTYYVIRVHEGEATVITPQYSSLRRTLTFETDRFSTYAIAYVDVAKPSAATPYTGDGSHIGLWITVLGLSTTALVTLLVLNRKKSKSKK